MQEKREKHRNNPDDKTYFFPVEKCITVVKEFLFCASMMMSYLLHDKQKSKWEAESQRMHSQGEAEWRVPDPMGTWAEPRTDLEFSALHLEVGLQWSWFQQLVLTWSLSSASKNPEAPPQTPGLFPITRLFW